MVDRQVEEHERDPADLRDPDRDRVRARRRGALGIVARDLQPQGDERDAHDHVARDHHAVVERVAVVDRLEHLRQAEREHDHADHLHERRQPEEPVVGVVGRGEPRVVQPRPDDPEGREREAGDPGARVPVGDEVRELVGGRAEGDDDRQVVEQLQRRGRAMVLVRVAAAEAAPAVGGHGRGLCSADGGLDALHERRHRAVAGDVEPAAHRVVEHRRARARRASPPAARRRPAARRSRRRARRARSRTRSSARRRTRTRSTRAPGAASSAARREGRGR